MPNLTLLTPYAYYKSTCGYCSPAGQRSKGETSLSYGSECLAAGGHHVKLTSVIGKQMSPENYEKMMDRGWRRSGSFTYQ